MSRKTSSFLVPFSVSFASVSCIGLLVIYFAFYRPRLSSVDTKTPSETPQLATLQEHKPSGPFGKPSFAIDETGVVRGTDQAGKQDSGKRTGSPAQRSASPASRPTNPAIHNARSTPAQERGSSTAAQTRAAVPGANSPKQEPVSKSSGGETSPDDESAAASRGEPMKKPAPNDGGNNLMRALKEAGQRKQQNLSSTSDTPSGNNPFDSILKSRRSNTDTDKEETE